MGRWPLPRLSQPRGEQDSAMGTPPPFDPKRKEVPHVDDIHHAWSGVDDRRRRTDLHRTRGAAVSPSLLAPAPSGPATERRSA